MQALTADRACCHKKFRRNQRKGLGVVGLSFHLVVAEQAGINLTYAARATIMRDCREEGGDLSMLATPDVASEIRRRWPRIAAAVIAIKSKKHYQASGYVARKHFGHSWQYPARAD